MMIWKTLHLYGFCSPENCVRCVSQHCGCNANHNQTPLLLLVISSLDVGSEESPWARAFPQRSPTYAVFHRQISLSLFLFPRYQCNSHTQIFLTYGSSLFWEMLFTLHAWRDFRLEVVPSCPAPACYIWRRGLKAGRDKSTDQLRKHLMHSSAHACSRPPCHDRGHRALVEVRNDLLKNTHEPWNIEQRTTRKTARVSDRNPFISEQYG